MSKVRIGFIGTGGIAGLHARQLLALPEVTIKAVADTSAKNRGNFIEKFGLDDAGQFSDYQEMLEQADIDAVVICSPHTLHFQQAHDVLSRGLHVLIEKPMTCSSAEAELLIRAGGAGGEAYASILSASFSA